MRHLTRIASAGALAAALAATAACNRAPEGADGNAQASFALPALPATLPLEAGAGGEIAPAPSASDLPDAPPLKLARVADPRQAYGYADAAYGYEEALDDAPPDYAFDYGDVDPWAWQGYDDSLMVAEPIDDGYRYYYYRPGAEEPYFVRDPWYSYGFAGGLLAAVYGADGGIVPYSDYGPRVIYASRYYARGRDLWGASRRARRPVVAGNWLQRRPMILAARARWGEGRAHQPAWQAYSDAERPRLAAYWQIERVRRQADARRFADWRQTGFRAAPPPRAIPAAWENARWARDDRKYRPAAADAQQPRAERRDDRERVADRRDDRQGERAARREVRQADAARHDTARAQAPRQQRAEQQRAEQQAGRVQAQAARQQRQHGTQAVRQRQPAEREGGRARQQQAAREQQQAQRQSERAERQQDAQPRREAQQARRPQGEQPRREAQQAQRQAEQAQRRQSEQAERRQAQQAQQEQRQAQQAQRQAEQAQRRQAEQSQHQAERQQAQEGQRRQAEQAQRQAQREQAQAQRQQAQQQRQERRAGRGDGPN